ncbi:MAG: TIR domain-containing protein [Terricaulis sp.]
MTSALSRFEGEAGERRLVEAFERVRIGDKAGEAAKLLAKACVCHSYAMGDLIVTQGENDNDFYLILLGSIDVERNGRADRVRVAGDYFGEMTLIDVNARRSASIRAREETIVAKVSEPDFARIAERHPELWRCLAVEIARRLRQRLADQPPKNATARVFIGSSSEGLGAAKAIAAGVQNADVDAVVWSEGVFAASSTAIETLEFEVRRSDFAVLVLSNDDRLQLRGRAFAAPRDNVVFELGLFMGALGRERVFVVCPSLKGPSSRLATLRDLVRPRLALRLPTDLLGVTVLHYDEASAAERPPHVSEACGALNELIRKRGTK